MKIIIRIFVALGEDCSAGGTACDDPTAMVCDPTDNTCRGNYFLH